MAIKGNSSKEIIMGFLVKAFDGNAFIKDKKIYVNMREGGEDIQICVALTCPKAPITDVTIRADSPPWEDSSSIGTSYDFTEEEIKEINKLLEKLNKDG